MKRICAYALLAFTLMFLLASCAGNSGIKQGTYSLNTDKSQQSIVIENKDTLKFVNFGENLFIDMFSVPAPGDEQYDEEDYEGVKNAAKGAPIAYTVENTGGEISITTKIGDFITIKLPYDKNKKTISFRNEEYVFVK